MLAKSQPLPVFNVRIYGILFNQERILVSDELHHGRKITKFPGGGLQFGEGTTEALKREFIEELNLEIKIVRHFYTVDFFQPSAFDPSQQVISIYYVVESAEASAIKVAAEKFVFDGAANGQQSLRWVSLKELQKNEFTFPIDQHVAGLLINSNQGV